MRSFVVILVLVAVFCLSCRVEAAVSVLVIENNSEMNVEAATAVEGVTYTRVSDPSILLTTIDPSHQMLLIMRENIEDDVDGVLASQNIEAFANDGGIVLMLSNAISSFGNFLSVVGGTSKENCGEFLGGLNPVSFATECESMTNGGYNDLRGITVDESRFNAVTSALSRQTCLIGDEFISCAQTPVGQTALSVRPMDNGGGIYFMSQENNDAPFLYNEDRILNQSFFGSAFNNLLVAAGAELLDLSGFPAVEVLFLAMDRDAEDDKEYYYTDAFALAAHDSATITVGGAEYFPDLDFYDVIIWSSGNSYYEEYVPEMVVQLQAWVEAGGVFISTLGGGFTYSSTYGDMPALLGIDDYYYCDDWDIDEPYYAMDVFPSDAVCNPLLNGGFEDMRGVSPDAVFGESPKFLMSIMSCMDPSTATSCLTSSAKGDSELVNYSALWTINPLGENGGVAVALSTSYQREISIFTSRYYRAAFNNLLVYAIKKNVFLLPTSSTSWTIYNAGCIEWNIDNIPEETMTISLVSEGDTHVITENIQAGAGSFTWPRVFGTSSGTFHIELSFPGSLSEVISGPSFEILPPTDDLNDNTCINVQE